MKFSHYLSGVERDAPLAHRGQFISYKQLKKVLKSCVVEGAEEQVDDQQEALFFAVLQRQLEAANRHFEGAATRIRAAHRRSVQPSPLFCFLAQRRGSEQERAALVQRAYWCRKYAKANAVALRKILKKHDKVVGNARGRAFLQECWRREDLGIFLHSPLLDELRAIEDSLQGAGQQDEEEFRREGQQAGKEEEGPGSGRCQQGPGRSLAGCLPLGLCLGAPATAAPEPAAAQASPALSGDCGCGGEARRGRVLSAILESPTCMLDSSDLEWAAPLSTSGGGEGSTFRGTFRMETLAPLREEESTAGGDAFGTPSAQGGGSGGSLTSPTGSAGRVRLFSDNDLRCPICLDVFYKPVGLGCGHKFCKPCALSAAGFGHVPGTFTNICSHIPASASCPQCRQRAVYHNAVRLTEFARLCQSRCPKEYARRKQEERVSGNRPGLVQLTTLSPYELLAEM